MDRFVYIFKKRIALDNKNRLIIQTGSCAEYMKDVKTVSYVNGVETKVSVEENVNTSMLFVYKNAEPEFDCEYNLCVDLPQEVENVKIVLTKNTYPAGKVEVEVNGKQIEYLRKRLELNFVTSIKKDGKIRLTGWIESADEAKIKIYHGKRELKADIERFVRADIVARYPEGEINKKCGFQAEININENGISNVKKVRVVAEDNGRITSMVISVNNLDKTDSERKKKVKISDKSSYFNRAVDYIKLYGAKRFIIKLKDKLTKKAERRSNDYFFRTDADESRLNEQRNYRFISRVKFSIIIPVYRPRKDFFIKMIDSVVNQTYTEWELCLADGGEEGFYVEEYLKPYIEKYGNKIKYLKLEKNLNIADNTNKALELATGEYIVFGDHDDELHKTALFECMRVIEDNPDTDLIYTDEDKIVNDTNRHTQAHFKSDFNLELLRRSNYICHLCVAKKSLVDEVGKLDEAYNGAQDYDFNLRCIEKAKCIKHIPRILYHWRISETSTAKNHSKKDYANEAGKKALKAHFERAGIPVEICDGIVSGFYKINYKLNEHPLISVIIPNKDHIEDLENCINSIEESATYRNIEYIVIENNSTDESTYKGYDRLKNRLKDKINIVNWTAGFNYAAINNFGVRHAKGEYLLFLNNDTSLITPDLFERLLVHCIYNNAGIVGAKLLYEDDTIQHAGIVLGYQGVAGHSFVGLRDRVYGYFGRAMVSQEVSAVTAACMLVRKSVFDEVSGFDEAFEVAFNDTDLCMKVREAGYKIIYEADAKLHHYESKSRGQEDTGKKQERFYGEVMRFMNKWRRRLQAGDEYYNPNMELVGKLYEIKNVE